MLIRHARKIIITQVLIIAALIIAMQSVVWLSNLINSVANQYATEYAISGTFVSVKK